LTRLRAALGRLRQQRSSLIAGHAGVSAMYDLMMVLIDESDLLTKAEALHALALQLAHTDATYRGLSSVGDAQAYVSMATFLDGLPLTGDHAARW
jgi:hypothetical protein